MAICFKGLNSSGQDALYAVLFEKAYLEIEEIKKIESICNVEAIETEIRAIYSTRPKNKFAVKLETVIKLIKEIMDNKCYQESPLVYDDLGNSEMR